MKPFLKWAGGKFKLVEEFKRHFPKGKRFVEPFLGSGAVSLNVDYPEYRANDFNPTLVALWQCVRSPEFIEYAETFFTAKNNVEATYYSLRERFNNNLQVYPNTWETAANVQSANHYTLIMAETLAASDCIMIVVIGSVLVIEGVLWYINRKK